MGNKAKRYGRRLLKLNLAIRSFYGKKRKRHESNDTRKSNKCSSSGKSELDIGSNSSSSKRAEEHEIIEQSKDIQWADFCEVLTVGENTWRYIDEKVPFSYTVKFSVYANGYIYWGKQSIGIPEILNAFDVGQEKFKVIQVPQEIRDKCKNPPGGDTFGPFDSLTDVGGHIALLQRWSDKLLLPYLDLLRQAFGPFGSADSDTTKK
ncbi:hypothetical protein MKW98_009895 [Papaver atlanticum]|uniref:F-box associated beta-propeller type 3 domain-containing protein n=1 Tax=Papaver atlanticum TaxID=357466 RepID=A0AAD4T3K1_9MAGN|nr:hypothetical protein MKW98_009895 [Papaver atlanticum]